MLEPLVNLRPATIQQVQRYPGGSHRQAGEMVTSEASVLSGQGPQARKQSIQAQRCPR